MELINKILENDTIFYSVIGALVFLLVLIICFLIFGKKGKKDVVTEYEDKKEVEEIEKKQQEMTQDQISAKMELQRVLEQMNEDITAKPKEAIDAFEAEQEENAIISYQELVNNVKNEKAIKIDLKDVYEDEYLEEEIKPSIEKEAIIEKEEPVVQKIEEPIIQKVEETNKNDDSSIEVVEINEELNELLSQKANQKIEEKIEESNNKIEEKKEPINYRYATRSFKTTEVFSPIFGKQETKETRPKDNYEEKEKFKENLIEIENTLEMEPLTDEDKFNEEFLSALKKFRKNL